MMSVSNVVFILHKVINIELAYNLQSEEFKCHCDRLTCNQVLFSPRLKDSWNLTRSQFGKPLKINSGHRCQAHNEEVGGVEDSAHTKGEALDISHIEFEPLEKRHLKVLLEKHFDIVIEYPTFYHCHNN